MKAKLFSHRQITPHQFLVPLLIAAILISGYLFMKNPNIGGFALEQHSAVHNLLEGNGWTDFNGTWAMVEPGYGILSYIFYLLVGDIEYAGMLVSSVAYLLLIPTVYYTVDFLFGKQTACLAAFLVTFWPALLSYSYISLTDCVFTCVLFVGFSLYVRVILGRGRGLQRIFLGLVLGLAYLIREDEGLWIAVLVLSSLFVFAYIGRRRDVRKPRSLRSVYSAFQVPIIAAFSFLVILLSEMAFIYSQAGVWSISVDITPVYQISSDLSNSVIVGQVTSAAGSTQFGGQNLVAGELFNGIFKSIAYVLATLVFLWIIYPFFVVDTPLKRPRPSTRNLHLLLAFVIFTSPVFLKSFLSFWGNDNFLLQYAIYLLILLAALAVRVLEKMLPTRSGQYFDTWIVLVCLLALFMALKIGTPDLYQVVTTPHGHLGLRAAGLWLGDHVKNPEELMLAVPRKGEIAAFYTGGKTFAMGEYIDVGEMKRQEIRVLLRDGDIDYLILDNSYTQKNQYLQALWENPVLADEFGFKLVQQDDKGLFQIYTGEY
jgi:hypothetical protein